MPESRFSLNAKQLLLLPIYSGIPYLSAIRTCPSTFSRVHLLPVRGRDDDRVRQFAKPGLEPGGGEGASAAEQKGWSAPDFLRLLAAPAPIGGSLTEPRRHKGGKRGSRVGTDNFFRKQKR